MKRLVLVVILTGVVVLGAILAVQRKNTAQSFVKPSPTIPSSAEFCSLNELDASLRQEGAAGTVYTTVTITNVSERRCEIVGNNFVKPVYSASNIVVRSEGKPGSEHLRLSPGQTVYSLIHYPNGPQCQSTVEQSEVSFMYQTSPSEAILFHDHTKNTLLMLPVCSAESESTSVTTRGLSLTEANWPETEVLQQK